MRFPKMLLRTIYLFVALIVLGNAIPPTRVASQVACPGGLCAETPSVFPLKSGEAVVTCFSGFKEPPPSNNPNGGLLCTDGFVVAAIDVNTPPSSLIGKNWSAPMFHNASGVTPWRAKNPDPLPSLGQVFGVTLDDEDPPNIYVAATTVYGLYLDSSGNPQPGMFGSGGPGAVYRINGTTGTVSVFVSTNNSPTYDPSKPDQIPNTGPAMGNIAYDRVHQQFFVTNFEDGKIYRIKSVAGAGKIRSTYDPFVADDGMAGFAPLEKGERLWAVNVYQNRVYFSVWKSHTSGNGNAGRRIIGKRE